MNQTNGNVSQQLIGGNQQLGNYTCSGGTITITTTGTNTIGTSYWYSPSYGTLAGGSGGYTISGGIPGGYASTSTQITAIPYCVSYSNITRMIMKLPKEKMPQSVYLNGQMLIVGIIGSAAEVAYVGDHLIFKAGLLGARSGYYNDSVILEYSKEKYNYEVTSRDCKTKKVSAKLISITKKC